MIFSKDFSQMTFEINGSTFNYGIVIDAVIYFVSVAAVVFFVIVKPVQAINARRAGRAEPRTPRCRATRRSSWPRSATCCSSGRADPPARVAAPRDARS